MKKTILDISHNIRINNGYCEIDIHNSLFRNSKFFKIHMGNKGMYIRYYRKTYYFI